jgi:hypothetical protein
MNDRSKCKRCNMTRLLYPAREGYFSYPSYVTTFLSTSQTCMQTSSNFGSLTGDSPTHVYPYWTSQLVSEQTRIDAWEFSLLTVNPNSKPIDFRVNPSQSE